MSKPRVRMAETMREVAPGVWVPAIPLKAPWDVRIRCDHRWYPADPMIAWACLRCGAERDGHPRDGRGFIGGLLYALKRVRASSPEGGE